MPLYDTNYVLYNNSGSVTVDTNGSDVSLAAGGALEGLRNGLINMAVLRFTGTIDSTTGNETLDATVQEKVGSSYRDIGKFRQIGSTLDPNTTYQNSGEMARCFFTVSPVATALRLKLDVEGTTPIYTGIECIITPTTQGVPW